MIKQSCTKVNICRKNQKKSQNVYDPSHDYDFSNSTFATLFTSKSIGSKSESQE